MVVVKPARSVKVAPSPTWSNRPGNMNAGGRASRTLVENVPAATGGLNMENRDPNMINSHVTVCFEDVIGEPDGVKSMDCCWIKLHHCYICCLDVLYKCGSLLCAFPLSVLYGCQFFLVAFSQVWFLTPLTVLCEISCKSVAKFFRQCLLCVVGACCENCGQVFWAFGSNELNKNQSYAGMNVKGGNEKVKFNNKVKFRTIPARNTDGKTTRPEKVPLW